VAGFRSSSAGSSCMITSSCCQWEYVSSD
jgi:hypothetical protein